MKDEFITRFGVWGQRHYNYLKKHSPTIINIMRMKGTLEQYLTDNKSGYAGNLRYDDPAVRRDRRSYEEFKQSDQMEWTRRMNSIRNRVEEFVLRDFVYA